MIETMLAVAGGILLARYSPRLWGRLRKAGKERRDVRNQPRRSTAAGSHLR